MATTPWNRNETIVAFYVYCQIPFKKSNKSHPLVTEYAKILGRSPSALNMKIGNFGRLDPELKQQGIVGLAHGAKLEEAIWQAFHDNPGELLAESERIITQMLHDKEPPPPPSQKEHIPVEDTLRLVKCRVGQSFFREAVLSAYASKCCISGVSERRLLDACHIVPWTEDVSNRLNPKNGLCLNLFFHKAYDTHLLGISPDYDIKISKRLLETADALDFRAYLAALHGRKVFLPEHFLPSRDLLASHYEAFQKAQ